MGIGDIAPSLFGECPHQQGMHFCGAGHVWVELIDPDTREPMEIETGAVGELVYTALTREAMPVVRFLGGDIARIEGTTCECGRTSFRQRVLGRRDDMFIVRGVNVYPTAILAVVGDFRPKVTGRARVIRKSDETSIEPPIPVEVGGGLRDFRAVESVLETGARWAVVGTRATRDAAFLRDVCRLHPDRIVVAVDARGLRVAVEGWTAVVDDTVMQVGARARDAGAAALLFTDVSRDGTELGPNVEDTAALAREIGMPVLASGGVGRVEDLKKLAAIPGVVGVVVGRALYTGAIDLREAQSAVAASA